MSLVSDHPNAFTITPPITGARLALLRRAFTEMCFADDGAAVYPRAAAHDISRLDNYALVLRTIEELGSEPDGKDITVGLPPDAVLGRHPLTGRWEVIHTRCFLPCTESMRVLEPDEGDIDLLQTLYDWALNPPPEGPRALEERKFTRELSRFLVHFLTP